MRLQINRDCRRDGHRKHERMVQAIGPHVIQLGVHDIHRRRGEIGAPGTRFLQVRMQEWAKKVERDDACGLQG